MNELCRRANPVSTRTADVPVPLHSLAHCKPATCSMLIVRTLFYVVVLYAACVAGLLRIRAHNGVITLPGKATRLLQPLPWAALLSAVAIAIPTTLQFVFPSVLALFRRDASAFWAGDWWRLLTPLLVQDGGVRGSIFNLLSLLLVGSVAERLWGSG